MRISSPTLTGLVAAALLLGGAVPAAAATDGAPLRAEVVLPPGNSTTFTLDGVVAGELTGDPGAFGANVDDQRDPYWSFAFFDGAFRAACAEPEDLDGRAELCVDDRGVPRVEADTLPDAWYGVGVAAGRQRLFLMDAIRRTARGTLSELTGPAGVPEDVEARVLGYTDDEFTTMLAAQSPLAQDIAAAHRDGINAAIAEVTRDPSSLPAEYVLLQSLPEPFTTTDIAAMGVLITRTVASAGGDEMGNVAVLRQLEDTFGVEEGRALFTDLFWVEDDEATVTVPRDEAVFPRVDQTAAQRDAAFAAMADIAAELPLELADGPGTGAFPEPPPVALPGASSLPDGAPDGLPELPADLPTAVSDAVVRGQVAEALAAFPGGLHGGSFGVTIGPSRTADGSTLLMSEPQLGYAPTLLWEVEVHAGDVSVRGSTVPGLPVVGIGYTPRTAWAVTTGNSVTIESFVSELRDGADGPEQRHDGAWVPLDCRDEEVRYRTAIEGVPLGPPTAAVTVAACRTTYGPLVATSDDGEVGRSLRYAMWQREVDNLDALLGWNLATDFDAFEAAMRRVTWNENTHYADADGRTAYWHPGLHHVRDPRTDLRLPVPGTGEFDGDGFLPFEATPQIVDPEQGFLANWNNKPAAGWQDGQGQPFASLPAGRGQRVTTLLDELAARDDWTFEALRELDAVAAARDPRATEMLDLLLALVDRDDLSDLERDALALLAAWDRSATGPGAEQTHTLGETATHGPAFELFDRFATRLPQVTLADLHDRAPDLLAARNRVSANHPFDVPSVFNLAMRVLDPASSSLTPAYDHLDGRDPDEVLLTTLRTALDELTEEQGTDDLTAWRGASAMTPVCTASGIIGPCLEMPLLERGTWIHLVGFGGEVAGPPDEPPTEPEAGPGVDPGERSGTERAADRRPLPVTGGAAWLLGLLLLGGAAALRPRRP